MNETLLEELTFKIGELSTQVYDLKNEKHEMIKDLYEALYGYRREDLNSEWWNRLLEEVRQLRWEQGVSE